MGFVLPNAIPISRFKMVLLNLFNSSYLLLVSRKIAGLDAEGVGAREAEHVLELSVPRNGVGVRFLVNKLLVVQVINLEIMIYYLMF